MAAHETQIELLARELGLFRAEAERRFDEIKAVLTIVKQDVQRLKHDTTDIKSSLKIIIDALAI